MQFCVREGRQDSSSCHSILIEGHARRLSSGYFEPSCVLRLVPAISGSNKIMAYFSA